MNMEMLGKRLFVNESVLGQRVRNTDQWLLAGNVDISLAAVALIVLLPRHLT